MAWISKYDTTFIIYVRKKYSKKFVDYDKFSEWLFFTKCSEDYEEYYTELEEVIREYAFWQTRKTKEYKELE